MSTVAARMTRAGTPRSGPKRARGSRRSREPKADAKSDPRRHGTPRAQGRRETRRPDHLANGGRELRVGRLDELRARDGSVGANQDPSRHVALLPADAHAPRIRRLDRRQQPRRRVYLVRREELGFRVLSRGAGRLIGLGTRDRSTARRRDGEERQRDRDGVPSDESHFATRGSRGLSLSPGSRQGVPERSAPPRQLAAPTNASRWDNKTRECPR